MSGFEESVAAPVPGVGHGGWEPLRLPEAPVFRPSAEEFADPLKFIASIREIAEPFGICKIVPPDGWKPPCMIDKETFKFPTRIQAVHELQHRKHPAAARAFFSDYHSFLAGQSRTMRRTPVYSGVDIDMYRMYRSVTRRGGYQKVCDEKRWKDIAKIMLQVANANGNIAYGMRALYQKHLLPYEEHVAKRAAAAVAAPASEAKAELVSIPAENGHDGGGDAAAPPAAAAAAVAASGSSDAAAAAAAAVKEEPAEEAAEAVKEEEEAAAPADGGLGSDMDEEGAAEILEAMLGLNRAPEQPPAKKRARAREPRERAPRKRSGSEAAKKKAAAAAGDAASPPAQVSAVTLAKAVKAEAAAAGAAGAADGAGTSAAAGGAAADGSDPSRIPNNIDTLVCELCQGGHHEEKIILCDRCDKGFHMFCLSPPLTTVPEGDWVCPLCQHEQNESYAFKAGHDMTIKEFFKTASAFKKTFWGSEGQVTKASWDDLEAEFWRLVEEAEEQVEVLYGADLDTKEIGSGFPRRDAQPLDPYSDHPWNVNNFPRLSGAFPSMLRHVTGDVRGVIIPWLYIGMQFSSFCWHVEDHLFYSVNYHHFGEPKRWYAVPSPSAAQFEAAFRSTLPDQFAAQPDLLFQLVTMLSPRVLQKNNVPVYSVVQEENNFIITFPGSYHCGFNHGANCAEAVNFAPADWMRFMGASAQRYRQYRKPPVICQEQLLLQLAREDPSPKTCHWARPEMERLVKEEREQRLRQWARGVHRTKRVTLPIGWKDGDADDGECATCHGYTHLSTLECDCCPGRYVCLFHADTLCECAPAKTRMLYRYSLTDLEQVLAETTERAAKHLSDNVDDAAEVKEEAAAAAADDDGGAAFSASAGAAAEAMDVDGAAGTSAAANGSGADVKTETSFGALAEGGGLPSSSSGVATAAERSSALQRARSSLIVASSLATAATEAIAAAALEANVIEANAGHPLSEAETAAAVAQLGERRTAWLKRAQEVLTAGNANLEEVEALLSESEQYLWGDEAVEEVSAVEQQLQASQAWAAEVTACQRGRPSIERVSRLLAVQPPPVAMQGGLSKLRAASQAADAWAARFRDMLTASQEQSAPLEMTALEELSQQGNSLLVEVPETAEVQDRLAVARELDRRVRETLRGGAAAGGPSAHGGKPTLTQLRTLAGQLTTAQVSVPEAPALMAALERSEQLQVRGRDAIRLKVPMAELQQFLKDAHELPAHLPEVTQIENLIHKANEWVHKATEAVRVHRPLKALRELLNAGQRTVVPPAELEVLRLAIRRREWEEQAKQALNQRVALANMQGVLAQAELCGAETSGFYAELQGRVAAALEWEERAVELMASLQAAKESSLAAATQCGTAVACVPGVAPAGAADPATSAAAAPALAPASGDAAAAGAGAGDADAAAAGVDAAAGAGAAAADAAAAGVDAAAGSTVAASGQPAAPADASAAAGDAEMANGGSAAAAAAAAAAAVPAALAVPPTDLAYIETLDHLNSLVEDGTGLGVRMERLYELHALANTAVEWVGAAGVMLASITAGTAAAIAAAAEGGAGGVGNFESRPTMDMLEELLAAGRELGVPLQHAGCLQRIMDEAMTWARQVESITSVLVTEAQRDELEALLTQSSTLGVVMPQVELLRSHLAALDWEARAREHFGLVFQMHAEREQRAAEAAGLAAEAAIAAAAAANAAADAEAAAAAAAAAVAAAGINMDFSAVGSVGEAPSSAVPQAAPTEDAAPAASDDVMTVESTSSPVKEPPALPPAASTNLPEAAAATHMETDAPPSASHQPMPPPPNAAAGSMSLAASLDASGSTAVPVGDAAAAAAAAVPPPPAPTSLVQDAAAAQREASAAAGALAAATSAMAEAIFSDAAVDSVLAEAKPELSALVDLVASAANLPVNQEMLQVLRDAAEAGIEYEQRMAAVLLAGRSVGPEFQSFPETAARMALYEGATMPVRLAAVAELQAQLLMHRAWAALVRAIIDLAAGRPGERPTLAEVRDLQQASTDSSIDGEVLVEELDRVAQRSEEWVEKLRKALAKRGSAVRVDKCLSVLSGSMACALQGLRNMGEDDDDSAEEDEDEEAAANGEESGGTSGAPSNKRHKSGVASERSKSRLFCLCQLVWDGDLAMLQCDTCGEWYHNKCMGLSIAAAKSIKKWMCPLCHATTKNDGDALHEALARMRKTRRPTASELRSLMAEARELTATVPEEQDLAAVLASVGEWESGAKELLESHQQYRRRENEAFVPPTAATRTPTPPPPPAPLSSTEGAAALANAPSTEAIAAVPPADGSLAAESAPAASAPVPAVAASTSTEQTPEPLAMSAPAAGNSPYRPLSDASLRALIKQSLAMEVDVADVHALAMTMLKAETWRAKADHVLRGANKPTLDALSKLLREAEAIGFDTSADRVSRAVAANVAVGRSWCERSRELMDKSRDAAKREHDPNVPELIRLGQEHVAKAKELPVKLDKEVDKLSEAVKPYCVCEQLYDEARPMLSCDHCEDWYHYSCVGMKAPKADDDDEDMAPEDYRCPRCCVKESKPYPLAHAMPAAMLAKVDGLGQLSAITTNVAAVVAAAAQQHQQQPHQPQQQHQHAHHTQQQQHHRGGGSGSGGKGSGRKRESAAAKSVSASMSNNWGSSSRGGGGGGGSSSMTADLAAFLKQHHSKQAGSYRGMSSLAMGLDSSDPRVMQLLELEEMERQAKEQRLRLLQQLSLQQQRQCSNAAAGSSGGLSAALGLGGSAAMNAAAMNAAAAAAYGLGAGGYLPMPLSKNFFGGSGTGAAGGAGAGGLKPSAGGYPGGAGAGGAPISYLDMLYSAALPPGTFGHSGMHLSPALQQQLQQLQQQPLSMAALFGSMGGGDMGGGQVLQLGPEMPGGAAVGLGGLGGMSLSDMLNASALAASLSGTGLMGALQGGGGGGLQATGDGMAAAQAQNAQGGFGEAGAAGAMSAPAGQPAAGQGGGGLDGGSGVAAGYGQAPPAEAAGQDAEAAAAASAAALAAASALATGGFNWSS